MQTQPRTTIVIIADNLFHGIPLGTQCQVVRQAHSYLLVTDPEGWSKWVSEADVRIDEIQSINN